MLLVFFFLLNYLRIEIFDLLQQVRYLLFQVFDFLFQSLICFDLQSVRLPFVDELHRLLLELVPHVDQFRFFLLQHFLELLLLLSHVGKGRFELGDSRLEPQNLLPMQHGQRPQLLVLHHVLSYLAFVFLLQIFLCLPQSIDIHFIRFFLGRQELFFGENLSFQFFIFGLQCCLRDLHLAVRRLQTLFD